MVVDDTPMNIDLLEGILTPAGYSVDSAESGEEALDKVSNDTPDLINKSISCSFLGFKLK